MSNDTIKRKAFKIVHRLIEAGFTAFIVGGAVRDMVMGIEPKDYDIITDASPEEVSKLFERTYPVGSECGGSLVVMGKNSFEVAQFRADGV